MSSIFFYFADTTVSIYCFKLNFKICSSRIELCICGRVFAYVGMSFARFGLFAIHIQFQSFSFNGINNIYDRWLQWRLKLMLSYEWMSKQTTNQTNNDDKNQRNKTGRERETRNIVAKVWPFNRDKLRITDKMHYFLISTVRCFGYVSLSSVNVAILLVLLFSHSRCGSMLSFVGFPLHKWCIESGTATQYLHNF